MAYDEICPFCLVHRISHATIFFEKVHMTSSLSYSASTGRALAVQVHDFAFYHVLEKLFLQSVMQLCGVP